MKNKIRFLIIISVFINGCSQKDIKYEYPKSAQEIEAEDIGSLVKLSTVIGTDKLLSQKKNGESSEGKKYFRNLVNTKKLAWEATLDVMREIPLISTDFQSGIIITDWYNNTNENKEKQKLTIIIKDTKIIEESIEIRLNKKVKSSKGWVEVKADHNVIIKTKNEIFEKMKQLN